MPSSTHLFSGGDVFGKVDCEKQVAATEAALEQLKTVSDFIDTTTSGDPDFDVDLSTAVNVARAALLRYQVLMLENISSE